MALIALVFLAGAVTNEYGRILALIEVRAHHYGEGDYDGSEQIIRKLLTAAGDVERSPETYVGFARAQNFLARDLHLVLGPAKDSHPVRFRVQLDGKAPGDDHGVDTDANDDGTVREQRLYQLIRQSNDVREHKFSIQFLDDGVTAYAFTFG
jgi:hypothetical protein